jgi:tryptophanyl-tRNA synthetase
MKKTIFSGIQPSGNLHLGNYIGAIQQWKKLQETGENELIYCVVDLHAITVAQDPKILKEKILELSALYLACGIDPEKSHIFVQSENPDHSYLGWILDCFIPIGWMNRMTQFKDKSTKQQESTTVGLFNYPALMAADILLYDTDLVPVGNDQKQHVELTRDVAEKFNKTYGQLFKLPEPMIDQSAARVMSLQNPASKMSKSDINSKGTINLLDSADEISQKVKSAVTDSGSEIDCRDDKPALKNLFVIYSKLSGRDIAEIERLYQGKGYADFKNGLAEAIVSALKPIQEKYRELRQNQDHLQQVLTAGRDFSLAKSAKKIAEVKKVIGLGR